MLLPMKAVLVYVIVFNLTLVDFHVIARSPERSEGTDEAISGADGERPLRDCFGRFAPSQ